VGSSLAAVAAVAGLDGASCFANYAVSDNLRGYTLRLRALSVAPAVAACSGANCRQIAPQSLVAAALRSLRAGRKSPHLRKKGPRHAGGGGNDAAIDPHRCARVMSYSHRHREHFLLPASVRRLRGCTVSLSPCSVYDDMSHDERRT
jgi:hypothetical protein